MRLLPSLMRRASWRDLNTLARFAWRRLDEERLPEVAGSLTFTTVLALVPVLTVVLAIFTAFPIFDKFRAALDAYFVQTLMPGTIADTILDNLNQFASQARRLSAFGALGLIVTTLITMLTIDSAFNHIWRVKTPRPLLQRMMVYWTIVTFGPLLVGVSLTVTTDLVHATEGMIPGMAILGTVAYTTLSILFTAVGFTLLYIVVPNRYVHWRDAAVGGLVAAVAFEAAKAAFVVFITGFRTYTIIYGALAALPIFLLWVYVSWLIALVGAVLAAALPVVKHERWWHVASPGSAFIDAMAVLKVLDAARAEGSNAAVDTGTLRAITRLGYEELESLLERMVEAGWVGRMAPTKRRRVQFGKRVNEGRERWTLLANPEQLAVADVFRLFAFCTNENPPLAADVDDRISAALASSLAEQFRSYPGR